MEGSVIFVDNHLYNCGRLHLLGNSGALVVNCFFHITPLYFGKKKDYVAQINNCKFLFDDDFYNSTANPGAPLTFSTEPQIISNTIFEGSGREHLIFSTSLQYMGKMKKNASFLKIRLPRKHLCY